MNQTPGFSLANMHVHVHTDTYRLRNYTSAIKSPSQHKLLFHPDLLRGTVEKNTREKIAREIRSQLNIYLKIQFCSRVLQTAQLHAFGCQKHSCYCSLKFLQYLKYSMSFEDLPGKSDRSKEDFQSLRHTCRCLVAK